MAIAGKAGLTLEGAWDSKKQYDRLTGVEYNNNLYLSKKRPPLGVPPEAGEYWMLAIEGVTEQVWKDKIAEIEAKLEDIEDGTMTVGGAKSAGKLATPRAIQTDLGSSETASFDGSENITPGVTGVLPLANGGTGAKTAANARSNLGLGEAATRAVSTSPTNESTALITSGAVYTGLSGKLPTTGTAAKATADANGNNIPNTYATKASLGTQVTMALSGTTLTITTK